MQTLIVLSPNFLPRSFFAIFRTLDWTRNIISLFTRLILAAKFYQNKKLPSVCNPGIDKPPQFRYFFFLNKEQKMRSFLIESQMNFTQEN